jgi:hypothetical protein
MNRNDSKERWRRNELREALQTRYKTVPIDNRFSDLLKRLDQKEGEE